ncbi:Rhodanese domain protein [Rhodomicrobium vannielii ATCC 17100]|uniref:Sulfurtransferase n=1 Tax=Rhodomicrobium vannielii (strain ATCC 17100 / DSM 162 / LMG 4299 / NCIMB 10020 / ATH 3.1.1) TaxID=648757 RepID=E3HZN7_RHOVT|nr:3-mercaptopyruvate sulfurtransferase [Rhodomicrobium vannielii]ADP72147.1 Rhodanese domain protein [Rhodomicrobium vannielii ATCC 17100]
MTDFSSKWLVETDWLAERLGAPGLVVVDAGLTMPADARAANEVYNEAHIPGALYFDIEALSDTNSPYPHMLPSPEKFASRMRKAGIGDGMKVVVYDSKGLFSAPRAWWMFRVMGHEDVVVLNGGLKKWLAEGRPVEAGAPTPRSERHFTARKNSELVREIDDMIHIVEGGRTQIADARSKPRFEGAEVELRPVARLGHMPGARNVPYGSLIAPDGTLKPAAELRAAFEAAGIHPEKPVITTCGSGVTACILALALAVTGNEHAAVYDGSWAEWSEVPKAPVTTGPA